MIDKNLFRKNSAKKALNKVHKSWIVMSLALLAAIGGGSVAAHADANNNANQNNANNDTNNHEVVNNADHNQTVTLVSGQNESAGAAQSQAPASSTGYQVHNYASSNYSNGTSSYAPQQYGSQSASSSVSNVSSTASSNGQFNNVKSSLVSAETVRGKYIASALTNDISIMRNSSANSNEVSAAKSNALFMYSLGKKNLSDLASAKAYNGYNASLSPSAQVDAQKYVPDWNKLSHSTQSRVANLLNDNFESYDDPVTFAGEPDVNSARNTVPVGQHININKNLRLHSSAEFAQGKSLGTVRKGMTLQVLGVTHDHDGFYRYAVDVNGVKGYVTANHDYVGRAYLHTDKQNFTVAVNRAINIYNDTNFLHKISYIPRGSHIQVKKVINFRGLTRLELMDGNFITANLGWISLLQ